MNVMCTDDRFEAISECREKLIEATNIEDSPEEMAVIDNILFRFWQIGWLPKLKPLGNEECIEHLQKDGWMRDHDEAITKAAANEAYLNGIQEAWTFAEHLAYLSDDVINSVYISANGGKGLLVAMNMSYQDAKQAYDEYFERRRIKVGDEVRHIHSGKTFVVTKASSDWLDGFNARGEQFADKDKIRWVKTGRHFDQVEKLLKAMEEADGRA